MFRGLGIGTSRCCNIFMRIIVGQYMYWFRWKIIKFQTENLTINLAVAVNLLVSN